ncbi:MAG: MIP family channel protein [Clostridia bacterium]|nr:MIP family channel protein [Clostridia bacterium]
MKKYVAELIGTCVLVLLGCGSAVIAGETLGTLGIALAFGLVIVAMAYSIGRISGCHVNPAVSLAMLLSKKMSVKDFIGYVVAQVVGAVIGSGLLYLIVNCSNLEGVGLGANGYGALSAVGLSLGGALLVEVIATFIFVLVILGVTADDKYNSVAGLVIGFTLALIHIVVIPLTGTSVNPARSLAPALFVGGEALAQVWVFIVAPLVGAAIAAYAWKFLSKTEENK